MENLRQDFYNYGLLVDDCKIKNFNFNYNNCELVLKFSECDIHRLSLEYSTYHLCPIIYETQLNNLKELILPNKKNFNSKKLLNLSKLADKKRKNDIWINQYRNFREIYNLAKNRDMYLEQSDFFYLMQSYLEKSSGSPKLLRFFSFLYHHTSNYGQNITRPVMGIFSTLFLGAVLFYFSISNIGVYDSFLLSFKQIIKPYSLLFDVTQENNFDNSYNLPIEKISHISTKQLKSASYINSNQLICYFTEKSSIKKNSYGLAYAISILESTLSLIFLALLLLALRWNFRKA